MTRGEFTEMLDGLFVEIKALFEQKNESYGVDHDLFYNFREAARRLFGSEYIPCMFKILAAYVDKHWIALCNRGLADPEFESRCKDIIVYCLLAIAMKREKDAGGQSV